VPYAQRITIVPDVLTDRSVGAAVTKVVKNSPGRLYAYSCMNLNASIRYFQLFNSTTTPGGGATPLESWPVLPTGGLLILDSIFVGTLGTYYTSGIAWAFSTTALTYTAASATDAVVVVRYM
jgi:hypothetical protein